MGLLRDHRHPPRQRSARERREVVAVQRHPAGGRPQESAQEAQERRLPRTVRSEDPDQLARRDVDRYVAQHRRAVVGERDGFEPERGAGMEAAGIASSAVGRRPTAAGRSRCRGRQDVHPVRCRNAPSPGASARRERGSRPAWSPDLRVAAKRPRLPVLQEHSGGRPKAPRSRSLSAHSGGTVWAFHPLPRAGGTRQLVTSIANGTAPGVARERRPGPMRGKSGAGWPHAMRLQNSAVARIGLLA